jgi:hypothetical protein
MYSRPILAILLLLVTVLLTSGCMEKPLQETISPVPTVSLPVTSSELMTAPTLTAKSIPPNNTTPWISIDPIPDHYVWDNLTVSGATNLDSGTRLYVHIFSPLRLCAFGSPCDSLDDGFTNVHAGGQGVNFWSFTTHLSKTLPFCIRGRCEPYIATVWGPNSGTQLHNDTNFNVLTGPQPDGMGSMYAITTYNVTRGEVFTFNNTFSADREVRVWLFGANSLSKSSVLSDQNAFYRVILERSQTLAMAPETYSMLLQYPDINGTFENSPVNGTGLVLNRNGAVIFDTSWLDTEKIDGFTAENKLIHALNDPEGKDKYVVITLNVTGPAGA